MFKFLNGIKSKIPYLVYGALALIVLLPLFKSGYVFAMDMILPPHWHWPQPFSAMGFFYYVLNLILPSQIIQKIILFSIFFLAGIGMHRLVPAKNELPKYFAGIFYVFNPFLYSRLLFGHYWLLMAYALTPFAVKSIFEFLNRINLRNTLKLSAWLILIGFISVHTIFFVIMFFSIAFLVYLFKNRKEKQEALRILKHTGLVLLTFLVFSLWWILPYFDKSAPGGQLVQEAISQNDLEAFKTTGDDDYGVLLNAAALYGFWGDAKEQYVLAKDVIPYWLVLFLIILALAVFGAKRSLKKNPYAATVFICVAATAFVFSVGVSYPPFSPLIDFLNDKFFIFKGFRDSQKFTALLVLAYAYFGAIGFDSMLDRLKSGKLKNLRTAIAVFVAALPILYSPLAIWGFCGQLYVSDYPQDWLEANKIFNADHDDFKILFLPWHQYMPFGFIQNKTVANPAPIFFDKETIAGDNMEVGNIYSYSERPVSKTVESVVLGRIQGMDNFGAMVSPFGVKYIILAKEDDWLNYRFLDAQNDLEVISDSRYLTIYQNKSWSAVPEKEH